MQLRKELSTLDATSIVVGTIIGSAIFLLPATIATAVGAPLSVFLIWIIGGAVTFFGALSLAELGSMYPGAGGLYVYLREAYGHFPAFLYGWGLLTLIHSGSIAALAVGFGVYFGQILTLGPLGQKAVGASCIILLTILNVLGIRVSKITQNIFTVIKVGGIAGMVVVLFAHGWGTGTLSANLRTHMATVSWISVGAGLVAVLWAYEGWHVVSFAAGEMKRPRIDLPRSLAIGTAVIVLIYLLANASYYSVLTSAEIRSSPAVAAVALEKSSGFAARESIAVLILISVLGSMNGMVFTGPRVYYAMAQDAMFFRGFGRTSERFNTPAFGLIVQGIWSAALSCSGTYQQLFTDVIFTAWLFYGLTVAAVIVLRYRNPTAGRRYLAPGFPLVPSLFCVAAIGVAAATIAAAPVRSLLGIGLILTGAPLFFFFRKPLLTARKDEPASGLDSSTIAAKRHH